MRINLSIINNFMLGLVLLSGALSILQISFVEGTSLIVLGFLINWIAGKFTFVLSNFNKPKTNQNQDELSIVPTKDRIYTLISLCNILGKFLVIYFYYIKFIL